MRKIFVSLCISMLAWVAPSSAFARAYEEMIIISGTLSDIGNYASVHGNFLPPPFLPGRSTNGPNLDDFLAGTLGFENEPSMHLVGPAVGNNFAVFQALAGGNGPEDLPAEIDAYLASRGGQINPKALHFLFIGGSDVINAMLTPDDRAAIQQLNAAVAGLETAIRRLVAAGAKTIYAPNFTDLGLTPAARKLDIVKRSTAISKIYNRKFETMLRRVERELDFELIRWDFFTFTHKVFDRAQELGFDNVSDACLDLPTSECDLERFIFINDFFPTSKMHRMFAIGAEEAFIEHQRNRCKRHGINGVTVQGCKSGVKTAEVAL